MSRIVLKISGEALKEKDIVSNNKLKIILETVKILQSNNHQLAIVVGGGNFFRGREHPDMEIITRDTIGMLGTVMNALYIKDYLNKSGIESEVSTPFNFPQLLEDYDDDTIKNDFNNGKIIIFGGGVGLSGYSTDSGTILTANKVDADLIIKMTNVDGVYDSDPKVNKNARKFDKLTFEDVINNHYGVMDEYAIKKCLEKNIKILVMNFLDYEELNGNFGGFGTIIE